MAKAKQNLNLKIQMLAGKEAKTFFERFFKNLLSLVVVSDFMISLGPTFYIYYLFGEIPLYFFTFDDICM